MAGAAAAGILSYHIAHRVKLPPALFLLIVGLIFSFINLPNQITYGLTTLAIILVVFDIFGRVDFSSTTLHDQVTVFKLLYIPLTYIIMIPLLKISVGLEGFLYPAIMTSLLISSSPAAWHDFSTRRLKILSTIESLNVNAITTLATSLLILFIFSQTNGLVTHIMDAILSLGIGVIAGMFFLRLFHAKKGFEHLFLFLIVLLTFAISQELTSLPLFSIMSLGYFFGSVKRSPVLAEFSGLLAEIAQISVLLLLGITVAFPLDLIFILKMSGIFILFQVIRYICIRFTIPGTMKEHIFLTLFNPKDAITAALALFLISLGLGIPMILFQGVLVFFFLSLITAIFASRKL